ncbi:hypothetical protein DV495_000001 [Geotrichum candidum]|uniref:Small ribosomal subunit protein uS9m n=1 Tax=Geotrichum candidum TaxID=1173061 RepID=A0A0J9XLF8_GEOCN|nr:hypothetical protein DV452_002868 [Geotrichum candidum]KAF5136135.1 hypothetical protein DV495_000001 [Geotrichum candidum]KAF7500922.1 hypothetical protein DV113_001024 [Geotrichum candidum]KAI9212958.1 hypothetical protein DS838_002158 [Geotrichum bryndzae]CDO58081.1 similar to Saccharomyces cerevisiae YBR146W MRPS9 Mitochondrial ribosomal protein of the small subunit [Geotrichum candidum]
MAYSSLRSSLLPRLASVNGATTRAFSTSLRLQNGVVPYSPMQQKLVAELNAADLSSSTQQDMININAPEHLYAGYDRLRVVPKDPSFYMLNPPHEENMRKLNDLLRKYVNLPTVSVQEAGNISWNGMGEYATIGGGPRLKPVQYKNLIDVLNRLAVIDPQLMPGEVWEAITPYVKERTALSAASKIKSLDEFGRAVTIGRRKTSSARLYMTKNTDEIKGQILVNGKPINEYFPRLAHRSELLYPLSVVDSVGEYNIFATVQGGGNTGQSGAIALAIARAIVIHNPLLETRLKSAGCLTRDPRKVERKKPGKPKARKSYTWVKR